MISQEEKEEFYMMIEKLPYEKATAEVIRFQNNDVITTSGENGGCLTWSNQNGSGCYYGLTES